MSQESRSNLILASDLRLKNEENYQDYKYNIKNITRANCLWMIYRPKSLTPPKFADKFDDGVTYKEISAIDNYARGDPKKKSCISNNLSKSIATQINRLETAKEM